ncbi:MAG TPA: YaaR family protein [Candidatus Avamphibacillus sp.]|nr:YaaR family protein [Candidatus Avamphibacillus sp.]
MKINQDIRTPETTNRHPQINMDHSRTFKGIVQSQANQLQRQEIEKLMNDITKQGEKIVKFRSFRDLAKFKHMVKRFLKEATSNGLKWQSEHSFHPSGQTRKLALVKEVDKKMMELTEAIMNQEKRTVDLLGIIGEIKGLLLNIYA